MMMMIMRITMMMVMMDGGRRGKAEADGGGRGKADGKGLLLVSLLLLLSPLSSPSLTSSCS